MENQRAHRARFINHLRRVFLNEFKWSLWRDKTVEFAHRESLTIVRPDSLHHIHLKRKQCTNAN